MHAGALRALEFDRIVSVVAGLAVTPTGRDRLAELTPLTDAARSHRGAAGDDRRNRFLVDSPDFHCGHRRISTQFSTRSASRAARSNRCDC